MAFRFELGSSVLVGLDKRKALVVGRAEFVDNAVQYLVQYVADGEKTPTRNWIYESALAVDIHSDKIQTNEQPMPYVGPSP